MINGTWSSGLYVRVLPWCRLLEEKNIWLGTLQIQAASDCEQRLRNVAADSIEHLELVQVVHNRIGCVMHRVCNSRWIRI